MRCIACLLFLPGCYQVDPDLARISRSVQCETITRDGGQYLVCVGKTGVAIAAVCK